MSEALSPPASPPTSPPPTPEATKAPAANLYPAAVEEGTAQLEPKVEEPKVEEPKEPVEPKVEEPKGEETTTASTLDIKLPEGLEVAEDVLTSFRDLATTAGLTSEQAQALADIHFSQVEALATAQAKAWETTIEGWTAEINADPVIGGDKKAEVQTVLGRALDEYGTKEAREAFDMTGAGFNPHIVRMIHKMALALSEPNPRPAPGAVSQKGRTTAERLYGN